MPNPVLKVAHVPAISLGMGVIDIGTVVAHFDDTVDEMTQAVKQYYIQFITADGRLRTMLCRKNVKAPRRQLRAPLQPRGRQMFRLKRHGTMLVHDLDIDQPRTVKVATICRFKDFQSNDWDNVRH